MKKHSKITEVIKHNYIISTAITLPVLAALLTGCNALGENRNVSTESTYAVDMLVSGYALVRNDYVPDAVDGNDSISEQVGDFLNRLIAGPDEKGMISPIPSEVSKVTYWINEPDKTVNVNFDSAYNNVSKEKQALCQNAIVETLCQIDGVNGVTFTVEHMPLLDSYGIALGIISPKMYSEALGSDINSYDNVQLHLFYANEEGTSLVESDETVYYNTNTSLDRVVVEKIIAGPKTEGSYATVSSNTDIISVSTQDGVCYVNLGNSFFNKTTNVSDEVMIYSIVNSLTELPSVNKVKILIDGDVDRSHNGISLSEPFERNLEIINTK